MSLGGKLDEAGQPAVGGILCQIDGRPHPQGQDDDHRDQDDVHGAGNVGQDSHGAPEHTALGGQQLPGDPGQAPGKDVADDKHQQGAHQAAAQPQQSPEPPVIDPAAGRQLLFHFSPLLPVFNAHVEDHVDDHDEQEQHQAHGVQGLLPEGAHRGIRHLGGNGGG